VCLWIWREDGGRQESSGTQRWCSGHERSTRYALGYRLHGDRVSESRSENRRRLGEIHKRSTTVEYGGAAGGWKGAFGAKIKSPEVMLNAFVSASSSL